VGQREIRASCGAVIRAAVRLARERCSRTDTARYLPLGFARVHVFANDYRARRLLSFGLGSDLICTVQVRRLRKMLLTSIADSELEQHGRYRINWNRAWLDTRTG
jgi:hypothetical protein